MKSAFITGAATGIGEGLVLKLQAEGWQVFAGYRSHGPEQARWRGKPNVIPVHCDVTQQDSIDAAAAQISQITNGRLDLLINNAAYAGNCGVTEAPAMDEYRKIFEVNFWGPLRVAQAFMPMLRNALGRVINSCSASVWMTIPMGSAYPAAKRALKTMTQHMRIEMAPFGVQVTALEPGGVKTALTTLDAETANGQWNAIPPHLRAQYQRHFIDSATVIGENFKFFTPEHFADRVYNEVICVPKMKSSYLIGPGVAALPWLHRLLPAQQVENIWSRMFRRRV